MIGVPFRLFVPLQTVGANLIYFDLWNASGSGLELEIDSVIPIVSGATAVTGLVGIDLHLTHTSAIGTGGTAATRNGTSLTAMTFAKLCRTGQDLNGAVTARFIPTGGATNAGVISWVSLSSEETLASTYLAHTADLVKRLNPDCPSLLIPQGSGISVVQGSVASVGTIGFDVQFTAKVKSQ